MKETELGALNHILQGIMDCSDMMNLFCLLKMPRCCKQQSRRLRYLMDIFQKVNRMYIHKYQEIPKVSNTFQRIYDISNVTPESADLVETVINSWISWETKGINLYARLMEETDESRLWELLVVATKNCLKAAQSCKKKYTPQSNNIKTDNSETTSATTNIRQRMQERLTATQK